MMNRKDLTIEDFRDLVRGPQQRMKDSPEMLASTREIFKDDPGALQLIDGLIAKMEQILSVNANTFWDGWSLIGDTLYPPNYETNVAGSGDEP